MKQQKNSQNLLRNAIFIALMAAVSIILARPPFVMYVGETFRALSFTYLPGAIVAAVLGPWAGLLYGILSDTVSFFLNPQGPYFPGFLLSAMLQFLIYGLFLYRRPLASWRKKFPAKNFLRALLAQGVVTVLIHFGLNFLWLKILYGSTAGGFFSGLRFAVILPQVPLHAFLITVIAKPLMLLQDHFLKPKK